MQQQSAPLNVTFIVTTQRNLQLNEIIKQI